MQLTKSSRLTLPRRSLTRTNPRLIFAAGTVAAFVAVPLIYIFIRAAEADLAAWERLLQARLWLLMGNTLTLVLAVTAGALLTGTGMAWLTERTDLPGRKVFRWMLALPLAIPPYIGAIVHLTLLRPRGGLIPLALEALFGRPVPLPAPVGFGVQPLSSPCSLSLMSTCLQVQPSARCMPI